jgi:hypothetical protein
MLTLVPGCADAELGPAARHHVKGGDDLRQQPGVTVGDTGDQQPQADALGAPGQEAEGGVALEHRLATIGELLHLEVVVHQRERRAPGILGLTRRTRKDRSDGLRTAGKGEVGEVDTQFHSAPKGV